MLEYGTCEGKPRGERGLEAWLCFEAFLAGIQAHVLYTDARVGSQGYLTY